MNDNKLFTVNENDIEKSLEIINNADDEAAAKLSSIMKIIPESLQGKNVILQVKVLDTVKASIAIGDLLYNKEVKEEFAKLGLEVNTLSIRSLNEIKEDIVDKIKESIDNFYI